MIKVIGTSIRIPRGDTGTLQMSIYTSQRTPYIMPADLTNPAFMFAVANKTESLEISDDLLITKFFTIPDYLTKYQFSQNIKVFGVDAPAEGYVYVKPDLTYIYYTENNGAYTAHPYKFVLTIPFSPADTANMASGSYRVNLFLLDVSDGEWDDENIEETLQNITYKETVIETREFVVEPASYKLRLEAPGYQFYEADPITTTAMPNAAPYLAITAALPITVNLLPPGFANPRATAHSLEADAQPTVDISASGPYTNKQFDFEFGIPDGTTYTPVVSENGVLSWTNDGGKENPEPVNINGLTALSYGTTVNVDTIPQINDVQEFRNDYFNRPPQPNDTFFVAEHNTVTGRDYLVYLRVYLVGQQMTTAVVFFVSMSGDTRSYRGIIHSADWEHAGNKFFYSVPKTDHHLINPVVIEFLVEIETDNGIEKGNSFYSYNVRANGDIRFTSDIDVDGHYTILGE